MSAQTESRSKSASAATYRNPKRYAYLLVPFWVLSPLLSIYLAISTGHAAWYWLVIVLTYLVFPALDFDALIGRDTRNPPESLVPRLEEDRWYRVITYVAVPCHYVTLFVGAWTAATQELSVLSYIAVAWSCGLMNGFAVATAHELGHKKGGLERWLSKICLATGCYGQYMIDHNRGHHRDVATPEDSGSARFGENFWGYMLRRQLPHSTLFRPWQLEKERLARKGMGPWTLQNEFIQPMLISAVTYGVIVALWGWPVVLYLIAVAFIAYLFLALADYIEHYGLLREKLPDGRYARVRPEHSWNTDHVASNVIFWNVQRHSDHHAWPTRRYQSLRSFEQVPNMPTGYPGMFGIALIPPLWRAIMYPRVLAFHGHDLTRMNVDPARREALMRRYHQPSAAPVVNAADGAASRRQGHVIAARAGAAPRHQCPGCGYVYDEARGDPQQGFAPGTPWQTIPAAWQCPDCAVRDKVDFLRL